MTLGTLIAGPLTDRALRPTMYAGLALAKNVPTMAAASNHSAFNRANAGGAWLGGLAISAGWGWASPNLVGAALAEAGLGLALPAASWTGAADTPR